MSCASRALDDTVPFISVCPQCLRERLQVLYSWQVLSDSLRDDHPIAAYCPGCEEFWTISGKERAALGRLVTVLEVVSAAASRLH